VGLVGLSGAGKTTLLRSLTGEIIPDGGEVSFGRGIRPGYVAQDEFKQFRDLTLEESLMAMFSDLAALEDRLGALEKEMAGAHGSQLARIMEEYGRLTQEYEDRGGYTREARMKSVAFGLGFTDADLKRLLPNFSGGQKTRAALARVLLREPDFLLLDEPTNFLDLNAIRWLEDYLKKFAGAVLVVSHDRYFLDQTTERILELNSRGIRDYPGNYSRYLFLKSQSALTESRNLQKQHKIVQSLEDYIQKNRAGVNARQARGRIRKLAAMERLDAPLEEKTINFTLQPLQPGPREVLKVEDLQVNLGGRTVLAGVNFKLTRGECLAVIGNNGTGKTTLIKAILGQLPFRGRIDLGSGATIGYFAQEHDTLNLKNPVLEELLQVFSGTVEEARSFLARFLFTGDDYQKIAGDLSGGERSRLALAKLVAGRPNFLILDEPTNHLDIPSREVLEEVLAEYDGTILLVSHDRYFINSVADRIGELTGGRLILYSGNYDYYRWKKDQDTKAQPDFKAGTPRKERRKVRAKEQGPPDLGEVEKNIETIERRLEELADFLGRGENYAAGDDVKKLAAEYSRLENELAGQYQLWESLID